jgi:phenylpyruvate tautomerase PptA (4-oxalocrotonate tautomerase family)
MVPITQSPNPSMPILTIEIVLRPGETLPSHLAADIADRAGEVFGSPPGRTWVKLRGIPVEHYAENGGAAEGVYPVFVSVLKSRYLPPDEMQTEVTRLTTAIAQASARPVENVHLVYEPAGAGRVAFGGNLVSA